MASNSLARAMQQRPSRNLHERLAVFRDAGLVDQIPTTWQLLQGQAEMMPYVVTPDAGDQGRYAGAPLGHPLMRTPVVLSQIGWEHFRVGHGLHSTPGALLKHLAFVYHEGMPTYDVQLVQTVPDGLSLLREYFEALEAATHPTYARQRRLIDLVIPRASEYRQAFLTPGGFIDRAAAFDYPRAEDLPGFLRPEFCSLTGFINYCARTFPESPRGVPPHRLALQIGRLMTRRFAHEARA